MNISRAHFLTTCGAAVVGGALDVRALDVSALVLDRATTDAGATAFNDHVNTLFQVRSPQGSEQDLLLAEVRERTAVHGVEQFSILFHGGSDAPLADGTYEFHHRTLGQMDLFIVAVGTASGGNAFYEACFSRFTGER